MFSNHHYYLDMAGVLQLLFKEIKPVNNFNRS